MWTFIFWKRFFPDTAPRLIQLLVIFFLFLSSTINPFIYATTNRVFREEFYNLMCWWRVRKKMNKKFKQQKLGRRRLKESWHLLIPFNKNGFSCPDIYPRTLPMSILRTMSSLELPNRGLIIVIIEASVCLLLNIISFLGNALVCLAVYKNPKLRSTINMYIIALAVSDLLCATLEMPLASAVLILGKWDFGVPLCEIEGFVDAFVTYVTPATMGLTAFNRYMRVVKSKQYNKVFSSRKTKIWICSVWLFLASYLFVARVTGWLKFQFIPGYAVCSVAFTKSGNRNIHYCLVFIFFFVLPFLAGCVSYYKVSDKIRQHKLDVAQTLQNTNQTEIARISVQEISISRVLFYVAAGFLVCWIPMWTFIFWKRFFPDTAPRLIQLLVIFFLFLSSTINPFIYASTNRVFREEFYNLMCWWRVR
ncbi:unnamed protein product, partial [Porites lobata]